MTTVSGLLVVRNAVATLGWAMGSLAPWVDEIVVVDMDSDDGTHEVVAGFGARLVPHEPVGYADPARPFGIAQCLNEWVVMLDADEMVPVGLSRDLLEVAVEDRADAVRIPMVNYALGGPCKGGPFAPSRDRHLRFFKQGALEFHAKPHTPPTIPARTRVLTLPATPGRCLEHFAHRDLSDLLLRADRYTSIQAQQDVDQGDVVSTLQGVRRAARQFVGGYLKHKGYQDGWRGFQTSAFVAYYELIRQGKAAQLREIGDGQAATEVYRARALELLAAYSKERS